MNKNYEVIHDLLCDLEKKIIKKGDVDPAELEYLYKLSSIITDYETREAMKKEEMKGGYSQHYPPYMWEDRMRGNSYDGMSRGDYSEEGSYRRGRDANTGRYVSRDSSYEGSYDRYSRDEAEDQMKQKLMDMMSEAKTDKAKNAIRQAIEGLR